MHTWTDGHLVGINRTNLKNLQLHLKIVLFLLENQIQYESNRVLTIERNF